MNIKEPLVSIITPVLNCCDYIEESLLSVLNQSYSKIEHIIMDGGSTDGTVRILEEYHKKYPDRITYRSEKDRGAGEALNNGMKMSKGEIIGWLNADDIYERDAVRTIVDFFISCPSASFVHGNCRYITNTKDFLYIHKAQNFTLKQIINNNNFVAYISAFYKRKVVEKVGGLDIYGNDYDYMIRIAKIFPVYTVDKILANFRVNPKGETGSIKSYIKVLRKDYLMVRQHGASIFARKCMEYYKFLFICKLGLLPIYEFLWNRKLKKLAAQNKIK